MMTMPCMIKNQQQRDERKEKLIIFVQVAASCAQLEEEEEKFSQVAFLQQDVGECNVWIAGWVLLWINYCCYSIIAYSGPWRWKQNYDLIISIVIELHSNHLQRSMSLKIMQLQIITVLHYKGCPGSDQQASRGCLRRFFVGRGCYQLSQRRWSPISSTVVQTTHFQGYIPKTDSFLFLIHSRVGVYTTCTILEYGTEPRRKTSLALGLYLIHYTKQSELQ